MVIKLLYKFWYHYLLTEKQRMTIAVKRFKHYKAFNEDPTQKKYVPNYPDYLFEQEIPFYKESNEISKQELLGKIANINLQLHQAKEDLKRFM